MKDAVAAQMFDPGSAAFRGLEEKIPDFIYCGEVNSKNLMGGYVGYRKFAVTKKTDGGWLVTFDQRLVKAVCF